MTSSVYIYKYMEPTVLTPASERLITDFRGKYILDSCYNLPRNI